MATFTCERSYRDWNGQMRTVTMKMSAGDMKQALGLNPKRHLPERLATQYIQGVAVWIRPKRKSDVWCTHRVMCACPDCGRTIPAGRPDRSASEGVQRMTIAQTKAAIAAIGMRARWSAEWREWRVTFPDTTRQQLVDGFGYFTDDATDALDTARAMHRQRYRSAAND